MSGPNNPERASSVDGSPAIAAPPSKVGEMVWMVPYRGQPRAIPIVAVGRKWLTVELFEGRGCQISKADLTVNWAKSEHVYADFYASETAAAHVLAAKALDTAWQKLRTSMPWTVPPSVTLDWIAAARRLWDGDAKLSSTIGSQCSSVSEANEGIAPTNPSQTLPEGRE